MTTSSPRIFVLTLLFALTALLLACANEPADGSLSALEASDSPETSAPAAAGGAVSFTNDILPIFERSCIRCHGGKRLEGELDLRSYSALLGGSENGQVIVAGDADASELVTQVIIGEMPRRAPKLETEKIQLLVDWVNQGARDN